MAQQVGLVLLRIVGQRRSADRTGSTHHRRDAVADFGVRHHRLEYVGRALGIADQHEARRPCVGGHGHDLVANLACVARRAGQRIDFQRTMS